MNRCKTGHHQPYEKPIEEKWMINTLWTGRDSVIYLYLRMEMYNAENEVKMKNVGILKNNRIRDNLRLK